MGEFDTAAEEARQQRATIRAQCDELIRLRHEHATMLATLTATQARCTEQEQKIRDQERELVELRGKQGAPVEVSLGPFIQGWLADVNQHDTAEQAIEAAKVRVRRHSDSGKSFVAQVARTFLLIPARAEHMEEEDFASPW